MDIKKLIRNPEKVHDCLVEVDGKLIAKKEVKIYIPSRFAERSLAFIGADIDIVGIYAIVVEDTYYGISLVNAMIRIEPTSTMKILINDEGYYEFTFEPGSTITPSVNLVKNNKLVYRIYDELIAKGRVPWYVGYTDLGKLFDTSKYHAGANIGTNHEVTELLVSIISRDSNDRHKYYRQVVQSIDDIVKKPPVYIPLRSVTYTATNTTNKLAGSYFQEGLVSALVSPSERKERIESILLR
jgi:hypothetical protein